MKMKYKVFFIVLLQILVVFSCNKRNVHETDYGVAGKIWRSRVEYVGDAGKVAKLAHLVIGDEYGNYQFELQTRKEPFGLIIHFTEANQDFSKMDFEGASLKLLALVKNAGYLRIEYEDFSYQMSVEEANKKLGFDIKDLYESESEYSRFHQTGQPPA